MSSIMAVGLVDSATAKIILIISSSRHQPWHQLRHQRRHGGDHRAAQRPDSGTDIHLTSTLAPPSWIHCSKG